MYKFIFFMVCFFSSGVAFTQENIEKSTVCTISKLLSSRSKNTNKILIRKLYYNHLGILVKEQNFDKEAPFKESRYYYKDSILYYSEYLHFDMSVLKSYLLYDHSLLKDQIDEIQDGVILKTEYKYDGNGKIVQQLITEYRMGYVTNQSLLLVTYNQLGQKSEELLINNQDTVSRSVFIYDDKNEKIKTIRYYTGGIINETQSYEYDIFGNLIKKKVFESEESFRVEEYTYEDHRLLGVTIKGTNGNIINTENRFYDNGCLIKIVKNDLKLSKKEIEFYDKGRIKETEFWEDNKLSSKFVYLYSSPKKDCSK